jgi:membrane-associated phospholipid phosphatase
LASRPAKPASGRTRLTHRRDAWLVGVALCAAALFVGLAGLFAATSGQGGGGSDSAFGDVVQVLGGPIVLPVVTLTAIGILVGVGRRPEARFLAFAAVGGAIALYVSRGILQVLGADNDGGRLSDFPSGHEGGIVLLLGALAVLIWPTLRTSWRLAIGLGVVAIALVAGWARVASGAHTWVDVAGGLVFAVGWLSLSVLVVPPHPRE